MPPARRVGVAEPLGPGPGRKPQPPRAGGGPSAPGFRQKGSQTGSPADRASSRSPVPRALSFLRLATLTPSPESTLPSSRRPRNGRPRRPVVAARHAEPKEVITKAGVVSAGGARTGAGEGGRGRAFPTPLPPRRRPCGRASGPTTPRRGGEDVAAAWKRSSRGH